MPRITFHAGRLHAEIDTSFGACLTDFSIDGPFNDRYPILRRAAADLDHPGRSASFPLAPWTNRIAGAAFSFAGQSHTLRPNFPDGTAIHGDTFGRAWRITDRTPVSARLVFDSRAHADINFPFPFACVHRFELSPQDLRVDLSVTNVGEVDMPAGCGMHPHFCRRLFCEADAVEVRAPVSGRYPADACIPTGPAQPDDACAKLSAGGPLGDPALDDCFAGFGGRAEITWPASGVRVSMDCSPELSHLVVFTPRNDRGPMPWFCVEPVTMANDAFNLETRGIAAGVRTLAPGETLATSVTFHVQTS
ncbi:MAG: hypothetical protein R3B49_09815 [Phycisphaerales bacterium]